MINVFRPHTSEYFSPDFPMWEKSKLESLEGISYINSWDQSPHILLTNTSAKINENQTKTLRLIVHANSGHEPFDKNFVEHCSAPIVMGNVIRVQAVVQYITSCLFQRYCLPPFSHQWDERRCWKRTLLEDLNILIIGYGHIGRKLHTVLKGFNATVNIYDPWQGHDHLQPQHADAIVLCCSRTPLSRHLIDADFLNQISPQATIVNIARGEIIDELSLVHFLENHPQAFAFLDVREQEPHPPECFNHLSNIATSSHVAGVFQSIEQKIIDFEYGVIKDFLHSPESFEARYSGLLLSPSHFPTHHVTYKFPLPKDKKSSIPLT